MNDNQKILNEIANQHLGKAGDGTAVKPYVTPDHIDSSLLVPIPRRLNRTDYGIDDGNLPFEGCDVWNAYEVSALTSRGLPVSGVVKIVYDASSEYIVESKSLKLYLNSFNMERMSFFVSDVEQEIEDRIRRDLSAALETRVDVSFFNADKPPIYGPGGFADVFENINGKIRSIETLEFNNYNENPNIIIYQDNKEGKPWAIKSGILRSNCRVTNQPDWGTLYVYIDGERVPTYESFLKYIVSMRKENHFHEEIVECIYKRLYDALPGQRIAVAAHYTRRGGIDINPIRCSKNDVYLLALFDQYYDHGNISLKTLQQ